MFENPMMQAMLTQGLAAFTENAHEWGGFEKYLNSLEAFQGRFAEQIKKSFTVSTGEFAFNVLNHADFHLRNILFNKDENDALNEFRIVSF